MTEWLELTINVPPDEIEGLTALLEDLGITGLVIADEADFLAFLEANRAAWDYVDEELYESMRGVSRVTFYLEGTPAGEAELLALRKALPYEIGLRRMAEEDWANNWKKYYRPIRVGEKLLIVPAWETVNAEGRVPLFLDPGLIFGTGSHPTTKLCLAAMEGLVKPGQRVLDLGSGSGILSIAALLLGAELAIACDIDPKAPDVVRANAALNGVDEETLTALHGDVLAPGSFRERLGGMRYDLILANIVADVIIELSSFTAPWLAPGGHLICSGIIDGREDEAASALASGGFTVLERQRDGDWYSFICTVDESGRLL